MATTKRRAKKPTATKRAAASKQGRTVGRARRSTRKAPLAKTAASARSPGKKAAKRVQPVPAGYSTVIPCFRVRDCAGAILFLQGVFGAKVTDRYDGPGGAVVHCELRIGDTTLMCGEAHTDDTQTVAACIYVKDCDATFEKAVELGAKIKQPLTDQFYGDRSGRVFDAWSNEWIIATHVEDVSRKEMERRMQALMSHVESAAG